MGRERRLLPTTGLQQALVAFRRASAVRACLKIPTSQSVIEGMQLALEAECELKDPNAILVRPATKGRFRATSVRRFVVETFIVSPHGWLPMSVG